MLLVLTKSKLIIHCCHSICNGSEIIFSITVKSKTDIYSVLRVELGELQV